MTSSRSCATSPAAAASRRTPRRGRPPLPHFGGVSPINAQNRELKAALEAELAERGIDLPVLWGNRNWAPYPQGRLARPRARAPHAARDRHQRLLLLLQLPAIPRGLRARARRDRTRGDSRSTRCGNSSITPDSSSHSSRACAAVSRRCAMPASPPPRCAYCSRRTASRSTDAAAADPPSEASARAARTRRSTWRWPKSSWRRILDELRRGRDIDWALVFQSRWGPPSQPWLEPDINDAIARPARAQGRSRRHRAARFRERPHGSDLGSRHRSHGDREELGVVAIRIPTRASTPRTCLGSSTSCSSA